MIFWNMTLTESSSPTRQRPLQRIGLVPFVAVLYAYCAGGPFGFEAMVSTAGPGIFALYPDGAATVERTHGTRDRRNGKCHPCGRRLLSLESHRVRRLLGLPVRLVELDGNFPDEWRLRCYVGRLHWSTRAHPE